MELYSLPFLRRIIDSLTPLENSLTKGATAEIDNSMFQRQIF